jgi:hypothetical protein
MTKPKLLSAHHDAKTHVSRRKEEERELLLMYDKPKFLSAYHDTKAHVSRRKERKKEEERELC